MQTYSGVRKPLHDGVVSYAGFWRRFFALFVDGFVLSVFNLIVVRGIELFTAALADTATRCDPFGFDSGPVRSCVEDPSVARLGLLFSSVISLGVWWKLIISPMSTRSATMGMRLMKIKIVTAEGHRRVTKPQAAGRALVISLVVGMMAIMAGTIFTSGSDSSSGADARWSFGDSGLETTVVIAVVLSIAASYVSYCWFFVDRRYQTLHDKLAGTVVIENRH